MAKTVRIRSRIVAMLTDMGPLTTTEIYNQLNKHRGSFSMKHGTTSAQLNNVLGKEKTFRKVSDPDNYASTPITIGLDGYGYPICVWDVDREYLNSGIYIRGVTDRLNQPKPIA